MSKIPVRVEVCVRPSDQTTDVLRQHVLLYLRDNEALFKRGPLELPVDNPLSSYVESIEVTELGTSLKRADTVSFWQADLCVHVFSLSEEEPEADQLESPDGDGGEDSSPCTQWVLPRRDFNGLWDSLVLEPGIKDRLLNFSASTLQFSRSGVREHIISANRMVLLHGPPGTGWIFHNCFIVSLIFPLL
jgi:pachytene checkpoint protein 2